MKFSNAPIGAKPGRTLKSNIGPGFELFASLCVSPKAINFERTFRKSKKVTISNTCLFESWIVICQVYISYDICIE